MTFYNRAFRQRCKQANLILCKTEITRNRVPQKYVDKAILFTDVATDISNTSRLSRKENDIIEFITIGHLDAWRGFDLTIEAMAKAIKENAHIHLTIVGESCNIDWESSNGNLQKNDG